MNALLRLNGLKHHISAFHKLLSKLLDIHRRLYRVIAAGHQLEHCFSQLVPGHASGKETCTSVGLGTAVVIDTGISRHTGRGSGMGMDMGMGIGTGLKPEHT